MDDNKKQHNNIGNECYEFSMHLIDFIDGTLLEEESNRMINHIGNCTNCSECYQLMLTSIVMTNKLQKNRNVYIDKMAYPERKRQINKINELIKNEENISGNTAQQKLVLIKNENRHPEFKKYFQFTAKNRAFASTAAGIVILVFISYIFLSMNNLDIRNVINGNFGTKQTDVIDTERAAEDNKSLLDGQRNYTPEIVTDDSSKIEMGVSSDKSYTYNNAQGNNSNGKGSEITASGAASDAASDVASASASPSSSSSSNVSNKTGSPVFSDSDITSKSNIATDVKTAKSIYITAGLSNDLWKAIQGFVSYYEIKNDIDNYLSIITYKKDIINSKKNEIDKIMNEIVKIMNESKLTVKIEIISGENTQKLVEYTSIENAELLSNNAVSNSSDFLIISIGR